VELNNEIPGGEVVRFAPAGAGPSPKNAGFLAKFWIFGGIRLARRVL
jgi:hypothetical protein